jgi:hypothetical protein
MSMQRSLRRRLLLVALGAVIGQTSALVAQSSTNVPGLSGLSTAYMKSGQFEIPFNLDSTGSPPVEVHLYFSQDAGKSWQLYGKQPPQSRSFNVDTRTEGTYWFTTRTIDAQGAQHPSGPMVPQLRVIVDGSQPNVEAKVDADGNGQIILDYLIKDGSPTPEGIKVEYMTDAIRHFIPANATSQPSVQQTNDGLRGRLVWVPEGAWRHAQVRVSVKDRANNETLLVRQIERPRVAQNVVQLASNDNGPPRTQLAGQQVPLAAQLPVAGQPQYAPHASFGGQIPLSGQQFPSLQSTPSSYGSETGLSPNTNSLPALPAWLPPQQFDGPSSGGSPNPAIGTRIPPNTVYVPGQVPPPGPAMAASVPPASGENVQLPGTPAPRATTKPTTPAEAMRPMTPQELEAATRMPGNSSTNSNAFPSSNPQQVSVPDLLADDVNSLPEGAYLRPSRSRVFSLDYEVESVGNRGVDAVELWGTRDQGANWKLWGTDPDKLSPFDIETKDEGVYGFRIVVVAGNGLASARPQPNEPADVYVLVDATAPTVRMISALYGEGDQEGSLVIRYACSDAQLVERPISLSYAVSAAGPWTTFATDLPNIGQYAWPADPSLPRQIFLRIEAVDSAGNVGTDVLDDPIAVEGLAPRARIRGFTPLESSDSGRAAGLPKKRR